MKIQFLFYCFLSFLLSYSTVVSGYIAFIKQRSLDFLTLCFVIPLAFFSIISIYQTYQLAIKESLFKKKKSGNIKSFFKENKVFWILSTICFVSLFVALFNVYTQYLRGTVFDEITQFLSSSKNIIRQAAKQQQPPLDYYFSAFIAELWEQQSKFTLRFHAIFSYLFLSFLIPVGLYRFCSSFFITAIGSCLFLTNHLIRLLSVYARPLSLALLTGFLFLFFYFSYCDQKSKGREKLFPVIASQYLFVMSIGLQPVVLILSLFLSSFILYFNGGENKKKIFNKLFLSHFITALLALPIYINMYLRGRVLYKFHNFSWETLSDYRARYDFFELFKTYFFPFYEKSIVFCVFFVAFFIVIFLRKKMSLFTKMIFATLLLFPVIYDLIFEIFINWEIQVWYFIILSLLFLLFVTMSLKDVAKIFHEQTWIRKSWRVFAGIPVAICFCYLIYMQIMSIKEETQFRFPYQDKSIDKIYRYLEEKGGVEDIALDFSLTNIMSYNREDIFYNKLIFYRPNIHPKIIHKKEIYYTIMPLKIPYINWEKLSRKKQKLFLIVDDIDENNKAKDLLSSFIGEGQNFGEDYTVFEWPLREKNKEEEYIKFLYDLLEKTPKRQSTNLYETLLYYFCEKNPKESKRLLKKYKELEPYLQDKDPYYNIPEYFELRNRIRYFEIICV